MLNFDNAFLYNKDIPVLMAVEGAEPPVAKLQVQLNFFPEGGDLVDGVPSQLAFEALDQYGRPAVVSGVLKTADSRIIDSFHTRFNGMGTLTLRPASGEKYTANWKDENGEFCLLYTSDAADE